MTSTKQIEQRYRVWFEKQCRNLACTKGKPAKELLANLERLSGDCQSHATRLSSIVENQLSCDTTLRWLRHLAKASLQWKHLFDSLASIRKLDPAAVVESLIRGDDIERAIEALQ